MFLKLLLAAVPVSLALGWFHADPLAVFVSSAVAIIPLADRLARATEHVAEYLGSTVGGILNASLANSPEIIIGAFALRNGLHDVVKASITGSILMNLLVSPGAAMVLGGWGREKQVYNRTAAGVSAGLMMLAAIGLVIPSLFRLSHAAPRAELSLEIAVVLFGLYVLSLVFTLVTHRHLFREAERVHAEHEPAAARTGLGRALATLLVIAVLLALVSENLTGALAEASRSLGLSDVFAGVIVVGVLGNVAELFAASRFARVGKMELAMGSTLGAATQVALVVAPGLVFLSYVLGAPLDLQFTTFEVVAITLSVVVVANVTRDGESNWLEGAMLLSVYLMFAMGIYFLPE